ncbi:MAG: PQQ-binding-like beta-propeller repeat protein, partial [Pirellulales bacterium]
SSVLFLDGAPQMKAESDPRLAAGRVGGPVGGPSEKSTSRCTLLAVDANSGKLQWKWPRDDDPEKPADDFRILAAPVPHRDLLVVPAFSGGAVYLYALQASQDTAPGGKTIHNVRLAWKTMLCDEPQSGANRWAPVGLCIDSGDIYVASGRGVVFAVEASSGSIRWAVRYQRDLTQGSQNVAGWGGPTMVVPATQRGWSENFILARGSNILVLPSDSRRAMALGRGSGDFKWELVGLDERLTYVLGVQGENLYLGGPSGVRCYSIAAQGRTVWEHDLNAGEGREVSHGRGVLTADAIYLPVKDRVYRLALENRGSKGQVVAKADVAFAGDGEDPVGNLVSDGKALYSLGPERVFALGSVNRQMSLLDQRIGAGDSSLRSWRMLLRGRIGQHAAAVDDLNVIYNEATAAGGPAKGLTAMLSALEQLKLAEQAPLMTLELLAGPKGALDAVPAAERAALPPAVGASVAQHLGVALDKLRKSPHADAPALLLRFIQVWPDRALQRMAETALRESATPNHTKLLRDAIGGSSEPVSIAAIDALTKVLGERAADEMVTFLAHASEGVRFAAARSLAQAGDRRALAPLVALLESKEANVRFDAIRLLQALTGERRGYLPHVESPDERKTALEAWRKWLAADAATAKLNHPLKYVHRTLITDFQRGRLVEFDAEGQQVWTSDFVPGAFTCQGLVGGNRLVGCYQHRKVFELDPKGTIVWKSQEHLPVYPQAIQRLEFGNTMIAGADMTERGGMVLELDREGRIVPSRTITLASAPSDVRRLPNGNTLVTFSDEGKVVELTQSGSTVAGRSHTGLTNPVTARRLPNGNTLICELDRPSRRGFRNGRELIEGQSRVTEYGPRNEPKEIVWTKTDDLANVMDAERLDNGHTLILDQRGLRQLDQRGQEVWSKQISGTRRMSVY